MEKIIIDNIGYIVTIIGFLITFFLTKYSCKKDIDKIRKENSDVLTKASYNTKDAYIKAITFLKNEIGVRSFTFLPYGLQLTLLVEYFNLDTNPSINKINVLKIWFWETSLSRYFGTSNTGQNARDLEKIRNFAQNNSDTLNFDTKKSIDKFLDENFRFSTSSTKTYLLLLSLRNPIDFVQKNQIDKSLYLDFPNNRYYCKLLNFNNSINYFITEKLDNVDLRDFLINNNNEQFLHSHFLSSESINYLKNQKIEDFIKSRKDNIKSFISKLINDNNLEDNVEYDEYE